MWQVSMTSKRKGWPGQLPNQSGYCPLPLFPALFYPVIVNVESSYNNILDTLDLTVSKSWAPSLSVFLWKQPWFPLPFFTIQWEEISNSVWCCPVKVKAAVKNSSSRTALALALFGLFYPKEELGGRRLHQLDQDVIEAITGMSTRGLSMKFIYICGSMFPWLRLGISSEGNTTYFFTPEQSLSVPKCLVFVFLILARNYTTVKPLSKYSTVMLHLSPATRILNENPGHLMYLSVNAT